MQVLHQDSMVQLQAEPIEFFFVEKTLLTYCLV